MPDADRAPDLARFFDLAPAPARIADLPTPVPVVDLPAVARNIAALQRFCDARGVANRPHVKTHKLVPLARAQLAAGARGLTVQKLGEAEVMADAGLTDLLLTFNVVGRDKLARLAALMRRTAIAVVADGAALLPGLSHAAAEGGRPLRVLVECDTGAGRNGVPDPEAALALAEAVDRTPGLAFGGFMTYPRPAGRAQAAAFLDKAVALAARAGLPGGTVSSGGSPDLGRDDPLGPVTEYRAGTSAYQDRAQVAAGAAGLADCALHVLATVVSRPAPDRAILDAGSKALTSDRPDLGGYGLVRETGTVLRALSEEHGILEMREAAAPLAVGDRVRILPNHVCPVSNLFDRVAIAAGDAVLGYARVDARGRVD